MKRTLKPRRGEEGKPLLAIDGGAFTQSSETEDTGATTCKKGCDVEIAMTSGSESESRRRNSFRVNSETLSEKVARVVFGKTRCVPRIFSIPYLPEEALRRQAKIDSMYADDNAEDTYYNRVEAEQHFPENVVRNQKYNVLTFLPCTLYDQFKYFYNVYFLGIALTQFVPVLKVGFLFTFIMPLAFVLALSIGKEGYDDVKRMIQDKVTFILFYFKQLPHTSYASLTYSLTYSFNVNYRNAILKSTKDCYQMANL